MNPYFDLLPNKYSPKSSRIPAITSTYSFLDFFFFAGFGESSVIGASTTGVSTFGSFFGFRAAIVASILALWRFAPSNGNASSCCSGVKDCHLATRASASSRCWFRRDFPLFFGISPRFYLRPSTNLLRIRSRRGRSDRH